MFITQDTKVYNAQTLQLFTKIIKIESINKGNKNAKVDGLDEETKFYD